MLAFKLAALFLVLFVLGVIRDRRTFSNAVLLGMALALFALGTADRLAHQSGHSARLVLLGLVLLVALGPLVVAGYFLINGITMARREGLRLANLLSLLAGLAIITVIGLAAGLRSGLRKETR